MYVLESFSVTLSVSTFFVFLTATWLPYSSFGLCGLYGSVGVL